MTTETREKWNEKFEAKLSRIFTLYGEDKAVIVFDEFQRASAYQLKLIQSLMNEKHSYVQNVMDLGMFSDVERIQRYDSRNKLLIFTTDLRDQEEEESSREKSDLVTETPQSYYVAITPLDKFYEDYFCRTTVTHVGYQGNESWMKKQLEHLLTTLKLENPEFLKYISGSSNIVPFFGFDIREDFPKLIKGTLTRMFFNKYTAPMIFWGDDEVFNLIANHRYGIMKTAQDDFFRGIRQIKCLDDSNPANSVYRQYAFNARKVERDIVPKYMKSVIRVVNIPTENVVFMTGLHETYKEDKHFEFFLTYCVEKVNLDFDAGELKIKKDMVIQRNSDNKAYSCADYLKGAPNTKIISSENLM
jgi:hypothetical protein